MTSGQVGSAMGLAQYCTSVRLGRQGCTYVMKVMQENAQAPADTPRNSGRFQVVGSDAEQLSLVAFRLAGKHFYDGSGGAWQISAERGWMVPAYNSIARIPALFGWQVLAVARSCRPQAFTSGVTGR